MFPISVPDRRGLPPLTTALVVLCIGSWIASFYASWPMGNAFGYVPEQLLGHAARPDRFHLVPLWLTPVTSVFVHAGILHLAFNMVWLWIFGRALEHSIGTGRYFLILVGAVFGSAIFQSAAVGGKEAVVGASGMVAGILGAFLVVHPKATVKVFFIVSGYARALPVPAVFLLLGWWIQDLLSALDVITRGRSDGVAHPAHLSGFLLGIGMAVLLRPPQLALFDAGKPWPSVSSFFEPDKPPTERQIRRQTKFDTLTRFAVYAILALYIGLCVFAIGRYLIRE